MKEGNYYQLELKNNETSQRYKIVTKGTLILYIKSIEDYIISFQYQNTAQYNAIQCKQKIELDINYNCALTLLLLLSLRFLTHVVGFSSFHDMHLANKIKNFIKRQKINVKKVGFYSIASNPLSKHFVRQQLVFCHYSFIPHLGKDQGTVRENPTAPAPLDVETKNTLTIQTTMCNQAQVDYTMPQSKIRVLKTSRRLPEFHYHHLLWPQQSGYKKQLVTDTYSDSC